MGHAIHWYARTNNKDINAITSQRLSAGSFEWRKVFFRFEVGFIQNYVEDPGKGYIAEVNFNYLEELQKEQLIYHSSPKNDRSISVKNLSVICRFCIHKSKNSDAGT